VLNNEKYASFMEQLSETVKDELLRKFMYEEFLVAYVHSFRYEKEPRVNNQNGVKIAHSRYTWEDKVYRDFMFSILSSLEPICFKKNEILYDELDEFHSVIYIMHSEYHIGYTINKKQYFKIKMMHQDVGAYGMTFKKRSEFIYKAQKDCEGFFIRRKNWIEIYK
jgi:hypothetical protein